MRKKQALIHAQKSGSILKVTYKSGSQPNNAREIKPLRIEGNGVFAKCLNSNSEKMFHINKLKLLSDQQYSDHTKWDPNYSPVTDYEDYMLKREKRKKLLGYLSIPLVIISLLVVYLILKSKGN